MLENDTKVVEKFQASKVERKTNVNTEFFDR